VNHENSSLAYYLANKGLDVWIMNNRGNKYDLEHKNKSLDLKGEEFWDFSFVEMALEDLPKIINYISKQISYKQKINVIGYSMGTSVLMAALSEKSL
jgi:lysosomal acid lipase/cholesteryl ester hydrolase